MATLILQTIGSVVGSALGGPTGAMIGKTLGSLAGAAIDARLLGSQKSVDHPHLTALYGIGATEGAPIPRVYGRCRMGGQMIWATRFVEEAYTQRAGSSGGKGGGPKQTNYRYFANFAIGLCEGPIADIRRIWADGRELDRTLFSHRLYKGTEDQLPDPLIIAKEGADNTPAYRGLAYLVFERFALADFGNRVPQFSFEVIRPIQGLGETIRAINVIPGSAEYAYAPLPIVQNYGFGITRSENRHQLDRESDWHSSIDALQAICPHLEHVSLVVSWFGDHLQAGTCTLAPRVDSKTKQTPPYLWSVAGLTRLTAQRVSLKEGFPAYGGTPSDESVRAGLADLKARGLKVTFYPFVMMDIPEGGSQPAYPWRGRITGTAADIPLFASQYRNFILHYARLCQSAGGVDTFLLGSEFVGLTKISDAQHVFPFVQALVSLAAEVRQILGPSTHISYSADWTEYGANVAQGGQEVDFPLDPLWASPDIDFIGIDAYWPLSDWRDGREHLDASLAPSIYDLPYLASRFSAGEGYEWFYQDEAARLAQSRTPITDGAYNKPWMFRPKDLVGWWTQAHYPRRAGREMPSPTSFLPCAKPIWLMEMGCPAVDRGSNAPNCFPDPKSSEQNLPPFSRGFRDDLIQRRTLEAIYIHFNNPHHNPISPLYQGPMLDVSRIYFWAWDARPFPAFPLQSSMWADATHWENGHWLNGRLESPSIADLTQHMIQDVVPNLPLSFEDMDGMIDGYVIDRPLSLRGILEPLSALFGFDAIFTGGELRLSGRRGTALLDLTQEDLVPDSQGALFTLTRAQESEMPHEIFFHFCDGSVDYRPGAVLSRKMAKGMKRLSEAMSTAVLRREEAQRLVDMWLHDVWMAREKIAFTLRPDICLRIGDVVRLSPTGSSRLFRIETSAMGSAQTLTARALDPAIYEYRSPSLTDSAIIAPSQSSPSLPGPPHVMWLDLAIAQADEALAHLSIFADPWLGPMALWGEIAGSGSYEWIKNIDQPSIVGETRTDLGPGPRGQWDLQSSLIIYIAGGALAHVSDLQVLGGANRLAVQGPEGAWEVLGFAQAELIGLQLYRLSRLLRGLGGESALAQRSVAQGAPIVVLNASLLSLPQDIAPLHIPRHFRIGPATRDYADASYLDIQGTASAKALMPYPPTHLQAKRTMEGTYISFIRQNRLQADGWEAVDIPMSEEKEAYEIEILKGGRGVRVLTSSLPQVLYTSAMEQQDFGAPQTSLAIRVYQMSTKVGRGFPAEGIL